MDTRNELRATVGIGGPLCCGEEHNDKNISHSTQFEYWSPTFNVTYYRHLTRRWSLGGRLTYMHWTDKCQEDVTPWNYVSNHARHDCYAIMPSCQFHWLQKKHFRIHSSASVGIGFNHQKQTYYGEHDNVYCDPAWDLTLVGFEIGGQHLAGVIDINMGTATLLSAGISYAW
ncbi:MAG: hypothetical protein K6E86_06740 [Bacteroidales bacterium]|nr:hypothetical protein [Bacteroidales bacterium]